MGGFPPAPCRGRNQPGEELMQVILLERVENLGQMGEVVKVKDGYARNFLLPRKKALRATDANKAVFENQRAQLEAQNLAKKGEAEKDRKSTSLNSSH